MIQSTHWSQPAKSIYGVVGRMELMQQYFLSEPKYHGLIPFLHTYYVVTKNVALKTNFTNPQKLEQLDIRFASLYFSPLKKFFEHKNNLTPWQTYFEYCSQRRGNAFLEMLLGINAHINSDLAVCIYELHYDEKTDYQRINRILSDVIPDVMGFLAKEYRNILAVGSLLFPHFTHEEFVSIIVRWRKQAMKNAQILQQSPNPQGLIKELHAQTEMVAKILVDILSHPKQYMARKGELEQLAVRL